MYSNKYRVHTDKSSLPNQKNRQVAATNVKKGEGAGLQLILKSSKQFHNCQSFQIHVLIGSSAILFIYLFFGGTAPFCIFFSMIAHSSGL